MEQLQQMMAILEEICHVYCYWPPLSISCQKVCYAHSLPLPSQLRCLNFPKPCKAEIGKHEAGMGLLLCWAPWLMASSHKHSVNSDRFPLTHTGNFHRLRLCGWISAVFFFTVVMVLDGGWSSPKQFTSRLMNRLCTWYQWWMNNALCPFAPIHPFLI